MAFCSSCGAQLAGDERFCVKCGADQTAKAAAPIPPPPYAAPLYPQGLPGQPPIILGAPPAQSKQNRWIWAAVIIAVLGAGYYYNEQHPQTPTQPGTAPGQGGNNAALASGYIDLGTFWGVTPYVGAGAGLNVNTISGSLSYVQTSNSAPYRADLSPTGTFPQIWVNAAGTPISPQPAIAFAPQNWDRSIAATKYSMAWALMAGVGIQLSPSATLDIGYRYFNSGAVNTVINPETGTVMKQSNTSQQVRIGIRYMAD